TSPLVKARLLRELCLREAGEYTRTGTVERHRSARARVRRQVRTDRAGASIPASVSRSFGPVHIRRPGTSPSTPVIRWRRWPRCCPTECLPSSWARSSGWPMTRCLWPKRVAALERELDELHRVEEALIAAAIAAGQSVHRSPSALPAAVLGVRVADK